jgi:PAS domain S-box-containing protein
VTEKPAGRPSATPAVGRPSPRTPPTGGAARENGHSSAADDALRDSEGPFRGAFEAAAIGFALVELDGRFRDVNRSLSDMLGYTQEELRARTFQEITHADDLSADLALLDRFLAGEIDRCQIEKRYVHKRGDVVWGVLAVSLVRDSRAQPSYFVAQVTDITALKDAERSLVRHSDELERSNRELDEAVEKLGRAARRWRLLSRIGKVFAGSAEPRSAIEEIVRLVVPQTAESVVVYVARAREVPRLLEAAHADPTRDLILRKRAADLFPDIGGRGDELLAVLQAADLDAGPQRDRAASPLLEALELPLAVVAPFRDGGTTRGLLALEGFSSRRDAVADLEFGRSLADRIRLEVERTSLLQQTQRAAAARDRAVGIVSHDLRTPLSTIQICATALLDPDPPPLEGIRHMGRIIQQSTEWMQRIAQDLLDRASLDAGQLVLHRRPTSVSAVVGAAQVLIATMAGEHEVELVVESDPDLPLVDADPNRLVQVLSNLLGNAMKFTPAGGTVVLSARDAEHEIPDAEAEHAGTGVRFSVSDNGKGISPEDLQHVFDWFWHSQREERGGTGLGLAIARGLVEAHGGRLSVESAEGLGSRFWFTMPAASAPA